MCNVLIHTNVTSHFFNNTSGKCQVTALRIRVSTVQKCFAVRYLLKRGKGVSRAMARIGLKAGSLALRYERRVFREEGMQRLFRRSVGSTRGLGTDSHKKKKGVWGRDEVDAAAAKRRAHEAAVQHARWVTSWMAPWERAQLDGGGGPLQLWERVYWRLFVVLGGVGFVYETWVLGNRRVLKDEVRGNPANSNVGSTAALASTPESSSSLDGDSQFTARLYQQQDWGLDAADGAVDVATIVLSADGQEDE